MFSSFAVMRCGGCVAWLWCALSSAAIAALRRRRCFAVVRRAVAVTLI